MKYFCCDELRRQKLKDSKKLNGIDFLEVVDDLTLPFDRRQRTLLISFFFDTGLSSLAASNLVIDGGTRIRTVGIEEVHTGNAIPAGFLSAKEGVFLPTSADELKRLLVVRTDSNGDFSKYTFRVVSDASDPDGDQAPSGFDPILSAIEFLFKAGCPSEFDCLSKSTCPTAAPTRPDINYLAKDYSSFRQVMLDRMALLVPSWEERSPADLGVTLVEWLAAIGDQLSYQQDAVATEAYLGTARRRTSVRRHARLVDYRMHDGCNARTWVHVTVEGTLPVTLEKGTRFLTANRDDKPRIPVADFSATRALDQGREVFEAMHDLVALKAHTLMHFYTWEDSRCCLPAGAAKATLAGNLPSLKAGDVLIFKEVKSPKTGQAADADPTRRHPVRLTYVLSHVPGHPDQPLTDPLSGKKVTEIEWAAADALPFPFCISSVTDADLGSKEVDKVSVALGNIVLADHGATVEDAAVKDGTTEAVPKGKLLANSASESRCRSAEAKWKYPRFRPSLTQKPLTIATSYPEKLLFTLTPADATQFADDLTDKIFSAELKQQLSRKGVSFRSGRVTIQGADTDWSVSDGKEICLIRKRGSEFDILRPPPSAATTTLTGIKFAVPAVTLEESNSSSGASWEAVADLLKCTEDDRSFAVEIEEDATGFIRFGDDVYGARPDPGATFKACYRVGNGTSGNVGAGSLVHVVTNEGAVTAVTSPLPAQGGVDPESMEQVRQEAPFAFRVQERAVTADDYARAARKYPGVQNAVASFRWTGSWHTVFLTIDRKEGFAIDDDFRTKLLEHIERYRLAGYDLVLDPPSYVPLEIDMRVCVAPGFFREDVKEALLDVFSNGRRADGLLALFHPDQFTFGQPVYLSRIYEAAMNVDGVQAVNVTKFQRQGQDNTDARDEGRLVLGRLEIARLDNDPNYPDHGVLRIEMGGGQ